MVIRLALADAQRSMLSQLTSLCSLQRDFPIVAAVTTGKHALQAVRQFRPDILLLDIRIASPDALTVLRRMRRAAFSTRVIALIEVEDDGAEALRLGASGVILKDMVPALLAECVRDVHAGKKWLEPDHAVGLLEKLLTRQSGIREISELLTRQEVEVARMVAKGLSTPALAKELAITVGTARLHLHNVYGKLNVTGREDLVKYVQARGLT